MDHVNKPKRGTRLHLHEIGSDSRLWFYVFLLLLSFALIGWLVLK